MRSQLLSDNDNRITLSGLRNTKTGVFLNAATVTAVVVDLAGEVVIGDPVPIELAYIPASDGVYEAVIDKSAFDDLVLDQIYDVNITATEAGADFNFRTKVRFVYRR